MSNDKPACKLVGTNGNVFAVISNVSRTLKDAGQRDKAKEWEGQAFKCRSYDDVLALTFRFVDPC